MSLTWPANFQTGIFNLQRTLLLFSLLVVVWITTSHRAWADDTLQIVALGDSLVAGYGLANSEGFVPQLQSALTADGHDVEIINAGVSGDTTAAGLSRIDWSVGDEADAVLLELGGNDALRGIDPAQSRANLDAMLTRLNERGLPTLLVGMRAPANLGEHYAEAFNSIYPDLAEKHGVALYPYFYEGATDDPADAQADGIHPSAAGVEVIVENMLPAVVALIEAAKTD